MDLQQDNNPTGRRPELFTAHVGIHGSSWSVFLGSYERAVEILYKAISVDNEPVDLVAYSLIYLMRHTLELGHKFTLYHLHLWHGENYVGNGHDLKTLHEQLRQRFFTIAKESGQPHATVEEFKRYSAATVEFIDAIAPVDFDDGQASRYPMTRKWSTIDGQRVPEYRTIDPMAKVNVLDLKNKFDAGMKLLLLTAAVVGDPPPSK